jgi:hypothetical protein
MDTPKPQHKFTIWNFADHQSPRKPSAADAGARSSPSPPFLDRQRRPVGSAEIRASSRPFRGRCVLPTNVQVSCTTTKIQPEWIDLVYIRKDSIFEALSLNTRIGLELEFFGLIHGALARKTSEGFSISPEIAYHELLIDKLAELHAEAARFEDEKLNFDRLTARITLRNPNCIYRLIGDETVHRAKIVMLSHKLATLRTARIQRAGTRLLLGAGPSYGATVLRSFETGFTAEFDCMLEKLSEDLTFC